MTATGGRHPIAAGWEQPWIFAPGLQAYMMPRVSGGLPDVCIECTESEADLITVPAAALASLASGLLAAHVDGNRPEWKEPR